jgi:NNP family nitrate/nitrite transporter-like MFS transporter
MKLASTEEPYEPSTSASASGQRESNMERDADEKPNNQGGKEGIADGNDLKNPSNPAIFQEEEGSLMHLYESRLRRLRDYEARVYSRYQNSNMGDGKGTEEWQSSDLDGPQIRYEGYYQQLRREELPAASIASNSLNPPSFINVGGHGGDSLEDISVSTGENSALTQSADLEAPKAEGLLEESCEDEQEPCPEELDPPQEGITVGESSHDVDFESADNDGSEDDDGSNGPEDESSETEDLTLQNDDPAGGSYTYNASADSKFEVYPCLVDPDQDDRAVEIALYSAKRPHMRAFHTAWLGLFVAFFNWFGIAPLMREVAHSLHINRSQVWTANTIAVVGSFITRLMVGPLNDIYGPRILMSASLLISAVPSIISGAVIQGATSLYVIRFLVGMGGCAFVTCQFWTASMFTTEVAGTALSLTAGWGNLGGGISQVVMGSLLFPLFKIIYGGDGYSQSEYDVFSDESVPDIDKPSDMSWRTILAIPGLMCLYVSYVCFRHADDTPKGNFRKRKNLGLMTQESVMKAFRRAAYDKNTWLMYIQYGCCFGVELTMTSAAALYFQEEFSQSTASAAAIASVFGLMNLFARGLGGFCSDMAGATYGMRGRLWVQVGCLLCQGALVCLFSVVTTLAGTIVAMAVFSIFVQAAEGSSFAIVPYINHSVTGSISGIVGAGGNFGAIIFSLLFRQTQNRTAFFYMGCSVIASSLLSAFVKIEGHRSLFFGEDAVEVTERRTAHTGQLGNMPNVDFHQSGEANKNRRAVLRAEPNVPAETPPTNAKESIKGQEGEGNYDEVVDSTELEEV